MREKERDAWRVWTKVASKTTVMKEYLGNKYVYGEN